MVTVSFSRVLSSTYTPSFLRILSGRHPVSVDHLLNMMETLSSLSLDPRFRAHYTYICSHRVESSQNSPAPSTFVHLRVGGKTKSRVVT